MKKIDSKKGVSFGLKSGLLLSGLLLSAAFRAQAVNISVTGTVYNDANGGAISGTAISSVFNNPLYVYAVDNSNNVVNKTMVSSTAGSIGTYTLVVTANVNYNITLSSSNVNVGASNPNLGLPSAYVPTAEGTSSTGDGTPDLGVSINSSNNLQINFAIDARPQGAPYTVSSPAYDAQGRVIIPASAFNATDPEDGNYSTGFANRSIDLFQATGGTLYYNNIPISFASASAATRINNFDFNLLRLAPGSNAASGLAFAYSTVDNAGVPELVPNTISVGFPLGVTLDKFSALRNTSGTALSWMTASEIGNDHFDVERSEDGKTFTKIGLVKSAAVNGISAKALSYRFEDAQAASQNDVAYYRLRQVDISGKFSYSGTIRMTASGKGDLAISTYPNPASGTVNVEVANAAPAFRLSVANASGSLVYVHDFSDIKGSFFTSLDMQTLPAGQYFIQYKDAEGAHTRKIVLLAH